MNANITQKTIQHAVKCACTGFQNSKERWAALTASGATDQQIEEQLRYEFHLGGGRSIEQDGKGGFVEHSSGKLNNLAVEIYLFENSQDRIVITGKRLISLVRLVFDIPPSGQLKLF